jgi:hypothetical protein
LLFDGLKRSEPQTVDRGAKPTHALEQSRRDDDGARGGRRSLERRGTPSKGSFGVVGQKERQRVVERTGGVGVGKRRRHGSRRA